MANPWLAMNVQPRMTAEEELAQQLMGGISPAPVEEMAAQVPDDVVAQQPETALAQAAPVAEPLPPAGINPLYADRQKLLEQLAVFNQQRGADEQAGIDDYAKSIKNYENAPQNIDWRPLSGLLDSWMGNNALSPIAQSQAPTSPDERKKELMAMKVQLQNMRQGLSKGQAGLIEKQLDAVNDQLRDERLIKAAGQKQNNATVDDEGKLRNDWLKNDLTKKTQDVAVAYNKVQSAAKNPSAAGDLSLIFGYMKMLDPGSTVREGEFATAQNAAGVDDRIRNAYNRIKSGERMNPEQRQDFIGQAGNVYSSQLAQQELLNQSFEDTAQAYGYAPDRVVMRKLFNRPSASKTESKPKRMRTPEEEAEYQNLKGNR